MIERRAPLFKSAILVLVLFIASETLFAQAATDRCADPWRTEPIRLNTIEALPLVAGTGSNGMTPPKYFALDLRQRDGAKGEGAMLDLVQASSATGAVPRGMRFPIIIICKEVDGKWVRSRIRANTRVSSNQPGRALSLADARASALPRPTEIRQYKIRGGARFAILVNTTGLGRGDFEIFARPRTFQKLEPIGDAAVSRPFVKGESFLFQFNGEKDERVLISMNAADDNQEDRIDSLVSLFGPGDENFDLVGSDDDGGDNGDARLIADLREKGMYTIEAAARSGKGDAKILVQRLKCNRLTPPQSISAGESREGKFGDAQDFCQMATSGDIEGKPYHLYSLTGTQGQRFVVNLVSTDDQNPVDTILEARVPTTVVALGSEASVDARDPAAPYALVAVNDDFGDDSSNASLAVDFKAQAETTLYLLAAIYEGSGRYRLSVIDCATTDQRCKKVSE